MTGLKTRKEREDRKSLMRQFKEFWTKPSTKASKQRPCWGKNTIWRFMKSEGWRPLRRQNKPLLTAKQRAARLKFAKQYKNLSAEEWDDFLFSDECPKYLFKLPNPKNDIVSGSQESQVRPAYQVKKSSKWIIWARGGGHMGRDDRPRSHWDTFFTPRTDFDCRLLHQQHITERSEACSSP